MNQFSSEGVWCSNSCSKYKGVIPQPNGRWSAQIYENNQCIWLGTFDSEEAAARATFMSRSTNLNFKDEDGGAEEHVDDEDNNDGDDDEREHMFEKPLTPSDVGKLNRLVIPKQHAEKYFPLGGDSVEKGLLLSFEDESEKLWRFRYSYWNSSQSYVLTKGWSRFVKEKQLDAGDVVWFERRRLDSQQLFIRWRRRVPPVQDSVTHHHHHQPMTATAAAATTHHHPRLNSAWTQMFYSAHPYPSHHLHGSLLYQQPPDCLHAADVRPVLENPTVAVGETTRRPTNSKRLRLFGVNLDCQMDDDESETETAGVDASFMSSTYKVQ